MASRSGNRRKRPSGKARKERASSGGLFRLLGILFILAVAAGIVYLIKTEGPETAPDRKDIGKPGIIFEEPAPPEKIKVEGRARPLSTPSLPQVAIVIDDLGYNPRIDAAFIKLTAPISFSFLPFGPHTKETATLAHNCGKDVLLHLPMEAASSPESKVGPGALFLNMDGGAIAAQIQADMEVVPYVKGINNHMGSKFTADAGKMELVLREIQKKGLFYLDSRTTPLTRGLSVARSLGVRSAERDVFLDNEQEPNAVRAQIARLISEARTHGSAIGIGHPHPVTYQVLKEELPALKKQVEIVPVSELAE
ncbi:MAG: divergent polysaccharide deacetylase family protein [Desulfovibrionales bacterium]|nr:divergent polysaccharide deacetylase family protein [Desulfovibrionales bacterium]